MFEGTFIQQLNGFIRGSYPTPTGMGSKPGIQRHDPKYPRKNEFRWGDEQLLSSLFVDNPSALLSLKMTDACWVTAAFHLCCSLHQSRKHDRVNLSSAAVRKKADLLKWQCRVNRFHKPRWECSIRKKQGYVQSQTGKSLERSQRLLLFTCVNDTNGPSFLFCDTKVVAGSRSSCGRPGCRNK